MAQLDTEALTIVEASLDIAAGAARNAFVRARTDGKPALRARVEELLSHSGEMFGALATEAFVASGLAPIPIPDRVGPFRITGLIAEGGMGSVAKAERDDGVYAQIVAIKLIRGDISAAEARERFNAERRILARLDHAGIARVIDGGSEDGRPWLAMEYVEGAPISAALDAMDASVETRLTAFLAACEAVAFAHRNLIVHADIKPANVLMRADGAIKLLDFGIAHLIVDLEPEGDGSRHPLTPGYAAPERARGGAPTVAGDIYSLGVMLREILPGARASADLDAITARATADDPARRYPDVAALVADARAVLTHQPVAARSDAGWRYRAGKFLRRHRVGAIVTGVVMALLVAAAITSTILFLRAEAARVEAERRFMEVRDLSRFMLFELYDDLADAPGTIATRARLADTARRYLEQLQQVPEAPADLQLDIARGWRRLAAVEGLSGVSSLGRPDRARAALDRAEAQAQAILAERPGDPGALEEIGWIALGRWTLLGDNEASAAMTIRAADAFAHALRGEPGREGARLGLLSARKNRGYDLIWANRPAQAVPLLRATLADLRRQRFSAAMAREARGLEAALLSRIGDAVYYAGDQAGSLPWYREQDAIIAAELARRPSVVWTDRLGEAKYNLSGVLGDLQGRNPEALTEARAGIAALERTLTFGADFNLERRLTILYGQESLILSSLGRAQEAAEVSTRGVALRQRRLAQALSDPQNHRTLAVAMPNHARILAAAGQRAEACAAVRLGLAEWSGLRARGDLGQRDAEVDVPATEAAIRLYCG